MAHKKPRIVIIGAGMAGLTAANKLYTSTHSKPLFNLTVVEGGSRIGGRINSSEFCGDGIEQGATWIHGIEGSPLYKIAGEKNLLHSDRPWECMNGVDSGNSATVAEGGHRLTPSIVHPISTLFNNLMNHIRGKPIVEDGSTISQIVKNSDEKQSVGSFLRKGLEAYWELTKDQKSINVVENWSKKSLEEAIFAMHENIQRGYSAADDLRNLDYNAEKDYANAMFPGEEITIARGYSSVVESLASVLPSGTIQLGRKVEKIEWQLDENIPVKLHFSDGTSLSADHVIVTVSLGVLKQGFRMFDPPLPNSKIRAISKLGFGVVNKVFLQLPSNDFDHSKFPFLQMVFHKPDSECRHPEIPDWIRKTSLLYPIYTNSRVLVSWITGKEALEIESLQEDQIVDGFSITTSNLLTSSNSNNGKQFEFVKGMRTQWGSDPLFFGSYSFIAVGSSGDDMDVLAEPLPERSSVGNSPQLQILFAGEATHRELYSTTHGAYFSGLREANRILEYYNYV